MSTIEPQIADEYAALERLLRAVEEYRDEVTSIQKQRGFQTPGEIPRINIEVSNSLLASIRSAAPSQATPGASTAPTQQSATEPAVVHVPDVVHDTVRVQSVRQFE